MGGLPSTQAFTIPHVHSRFLSHPFRLSRSLSPFPKLPLSLGFSKNGSETMYCGLLEYPSCCVDGGSNYAWVHWWRCGHISSLIGRRWVVFHWIHSMCLCRWVNEGAHECPQPRHQIWSSYIHLFRDRSRFTFLSFFLFYPLSHLHSQHLVWTPLEDQDRLSFQIRIGWASVLNTYWSKGTKSVGENKR